VFENWDQNPIVIFLKEQWDRFKNFVSPLTDLCFGNRGKFQKLDNKSEQSEGESDEEVKSSSSPIEGVNQSSQSIAPTARPQPQPQLPAQASASAKISTTTITTGIVSTASIAGRVNIAKYNLSTFRKIK
jgi:hypothetical protein